MKKRFAGFLAVLIIAVMLAVPASAMQGYTPDFEPTAEGAYIVNLDTNIVVYQKDSEKQLTAASLTKMMTMLLLLKNHQDELDTATGEMTRAIDDILYRTPGASLADIRPGESVTLRNLLYAMELPSGNEAAYIAAFFMGGTVENFVAMMNEEAKALGCTGTVFTDPCGLDTGNVTTARDAYLILRALIQYDAFVEIAGTSSYWMPANTQHAEPYIILSSNKMLTQGTTYYRSYTQGGKTGSLSEGWQNFASWHTQNGETYISVLLHSSADQEVDPRPALTETGTLMDWVFQTFTIQSALDTTRPITERPIRYSTDTDTIMLYPADDMMTLLPSDGGAALTEQTFSLPEYLTAPVEQGDVVGTVTLSINGEKLGTVDLIAGSTVSRNQVLYTLTKVGEFFSGTYFKVVVILTMIVVAVYAFVWVCAILIEGNRGPKRRN